MVFGQPWPSASHHRPRLDGHGQPLATAFRPRPTLPLGKSMNFNEKYIGGKHLGVRNMKLSISALTKSYKLIKTSDAKEAEKSANKLEVGPMWRQSNPCEIY